MTIIEFDNINLAVTFRSKQSEMFFGGPYHVDMNENHN